MKWALYMATVAFACGLLYGVTSWELWVCICAGFLFVWIIALIYMAIQSAIQRNKKYYISELQRYKSLYASEILRHKTFEKRLIEDMLSLVELYDYYKSSSTLNNHEDEVDIIHHVMSDFNEYSKYTD